MREEGTKEKKEWKDSLIDRRLYPAGSQGH
jgi:hypothetical protein